MIKYLNTFHIQKLPLEEFTKLADRFCINPVFKSLLDSINNQFKIYNAAFILNVRNSTVFKNRMQTINGFLEYFDIKIF